MSNEANSAVTVRRYGERPVRLTHPDGHSLVGTQYAAYPVDEPPVIEVPALGRCWYRAVWEKHGWVVADV